MALAAEPPDISMGTHLGEVSSHTRSLTHSFTHSLTHRMNAFADRHVQQPTCSWSIAYLNAQNDCGKCDDFNFEPDGLAVYTVATS